MSNARDPNKVLIVVGDATETVDTLYPILRLKEERLTPVVAAPQKRRYNMVLHEIPEHGWDITREFEGYTIMADIAFSDIVPEDYVGIFFSGGRAPEYIRDDPHLIRLTQHFFDTGKPIASVCHGVEIPARADRVRGRRMACVPKCRFDLEICGGVYSEENFCIDGNLFSGRTWHDHGDYIGHWVRALNAQRMMAAA